MNAGPDGSSFILVCPSVSQWPSPASLHLFSDLNISLHLLGTVQVGVKTSFKLQNGRGGKHVSMYATQLCKDTAAPAPPSLSHAHTGYANTNI